MLFEIMTKNFIIETKWLFDMDSQARQEQSRAGPAHSLRSSVKGEASHFFLHISKASLLSWPKIEFHFS